MFSLDGDLIAFNNQAFFPSTYDLYLKSIEVSSIVIDDELSSSLTLNDSFEIDYATTTSPGYKYCHQR